MIHDLLSKFLTFISLVAKFGKEVQQRLLFFLLLVAGKSEHVFWLPIITRVITVVDIVDAFKRMQALRPQQIFVDDYAFKIIIYSVTEELMLVKDIVWHLLTAHQFGKLDKFIGTNIWVLIFVLNVRIDLMSA